MHSVAAESTNIVDWNGASGNAAYARWSDFPISQLSHHGRECCDGARAWLRNMDFAQLNGSDLASGPRWIRKQYEWGPSSWPMHWCEALNSQVIDCGAHAALAQEAFEARGLTAFQAQFVQSYGSNAIAQWRTRWAAADVSDHWLGEGQIYHEGNALLVGGDEVKLWDGSASCWLNPIQTSGYGGLIAVRIVTNGARLAPVRWGDHVVTPDVWQSLPASGASDQI